MKTFSTLMLVCLMVGVGPRAAVGQVPSSPRSHAGVALTLVAPLGLGADIAVPIGERVNLRGGFNVLQFGHDFDEEGIMYAAQLKLRSVSAHLDWFPFGGGFHVSPGVMLYNGNEGAADATVPSGGTFALGDESLTSDPADPVRGTAAVSFERKVAPSVRIGWGNIVPRGNRRWSVPFEIGVVFSDEATTAFSLGGSACASDGTNCRDIAADPELQAEVRKEQEQLNDDLSVLKVIPVISLGFSIRF